MDSSNSTQDPSLSVQQPPSKAGSRRLPPPCWSHDETVALIDAYRDKWYSLRRGNLRAPHWQEVADGVAFRCPLGNPPKTSIQCRHKMEKLRKRYRAEIQRIENNPKGHRYPSSWVNFKLMDSMELGFSPSVDQDGDEDDGNDAVIEDDLMLYPKGIKQAMALPLTRLYPASSGNSNGNGVRIKIPNTSALQTPPPPRLNLYNSNSNRSFDDYPPPMNPHYGSGKGSQNGYLKEAAKDRNVGGVGLLKKRKVMVINDDNNSSSSRNVMDEMVAAINILGDGFVKMERMKIDMARELETMRMKMEMKRTEMILESHQKLLDSFSKTVLDKEMKRMPTPES